jgi:translation initiation factor RLI1
MKEYFPEFIRKEVRTVVYNAYIDALDYKQIACKVSDVLKQEISEDEIDAIIDYYNMIYI